jgi:lysozyme
MDQSILRAELRHDEGEKLVAYKDSLGLWTVGVGHLIDPSKGANPAPFGVDLRKGGSITEAQSDALLDADIDAKCTQLDEHIAWWRDLDEVRQRVIVNMAFNLGVAGLLGFKNTLACVHEARFDDAADGMLASKWARQVGKRADRLAGMMRTGTV